MDLITTHINADFDALASMVAAKKLYPDARLLLPGSQERAVRRFLSLSKDLIKIKTERQCRLDDVDRLILVETRLASRIGKAGNLLGKKGLKLHIYDHHPRTKDDIRAERDIYEKVGATVTILVEQIRKNRIPISPLEATIMALGIYQDTGSLLFPTTTRQDVDAVSFLIENGANLNMVFSYLKDELNVKELSLLAKLLQSTQQVSIKGVTVGIAACSAKGFVGELAYLVHKLMEIENFNAVFVLAEVEKGTLLIARSQLKSLNVARVAEAFGGGGHSTAASAMIKAVACDEVKKRLLDVIRKSAVASVCAKDIMAQPVHTVLPGESVDTALRLMNKFGVDALLVTKRGKMLGIISKDAAEGGCGEGKGHSRITGFMSHGVITIRPTTSVRQMSEIIFQKKTGHLVVTRKKKPVGIVTRTAILAGVHRMMATGLKSTSPKQAAAYLKTWYGPGKFRRPPQYERKTKKKISLLKKLNASLPKSAIRIFKALGAAADSAGIRAYLVGGFVRDLILGVENFDMDIVVEGDAIEFARRVSKRIKAELLIHKRFKTATIVTEWPARNRRLESKPPGYEKLKIDIASARREYYQMPAALPTVEFANIREDLYRRDFTINAMAAGLNSDSFGRLFDFFAGLEDLKAKKIRVLHDLSFVDDPTRILRAVRFEQRLGFEIEAHTRQLIEHALRLDMIAGLKKHRLRDEIVLILSEPRPINAIERMNQLHELKFIHPRLKLTKRLLTLLQSVGETAAWFKQEHFRKRRLDSWLLYLLVLLGPLNFDQTKRFCEDFTFTEADKKRVLLFKKNGLQLKESLNAPKRMQPSKIYRLLEPLPYEVILMCMAMSQTERARHRIKTFLTKYNGMKIEIKGEDLKQAGCMPGPAFKEVLTKVLYAKLDGKIKTRQEQLRLAQRLIERSR